ncbi:hypothetical protein GCM10009554_36550 [Kribbella koreensis]|uniref:Uncharacterized protein n=1 Tax=Kribbella koreensis TaxID=57909 RepID=A0ABP4B3Y0_9ACTN
MPAALAENQPLIPEVRHNLDLPADRLDIPAIALNSDHPNPPTTARLTRLPLQNLSQPINTHLPPEHSQLGREAALAARIAVGSADNCRIGGPPRIPN